MQLFRFSKKEFRNTTTLLYKPWPRGEGEVFAKGNQSNHTKKGNPIGNVVYPTT
jgi:hypothetical protein